MFEFLLSVGVVIGACLFAVTVQRIARKNDPAYKFPGPEEFSKQKKAA